MRAFVPQAGPDLVKRAERLVAELTAEPWGRVSPSVYETGRVVALAPWLTRHRARVEYLLATQRPDGGWGGPEGYGLVPTLSAVDALLDTAVRTGSGAAAEAVSRGLRTLFGWLRRSPALRLPDMPAIELIVTSLIHSINKRLDELGELGDLWPPGLGDWRGTARLSPPRVGEAPLGALRSWLATGAPVPQKLLHALEVAGEAAAGADRAVVTPVGSVGASPAATAAWLAARGPIEPRNPARRHLESVVRRYGGPVPCGVPVTVFERAWVLSTLARAGLPLRVPEEVVWSLTPASDPEGTPAGPGLPPDADTTSVALYALASLGLPYEPESLWPYQTETHFCTWKGEQGVSPTVNAHVLDAFGRHLEIDPAAGPRYGPAVARVSAWLREQQAPDGSWTDRWHASPYYATACCALALADYGGAESAAAVRAAVEWVLGTQREDGSWGRWSGTAEETAYAMHVLLLTGGNPGARAREAARRGRGYLLERNDPPPRDPPLWHDKDLYAPQAIVGAAVLAALHIAERISSTTL